VAALAAAPLEHDVAEGQVELVVDHDSRSGGTLKNRAAATTCPPDSFMYDVGARAPSRARAAADRAQSRLRDLARERWAESPRRVGGELGHDHLARRCAGCRRTGPGLPSPTTSQGSSAPATPSAVAGDLDGRAQPGRPSRGGPSRRHPRARPRRVPRASRVTMTAIASGSPCRDAPAGSAICPAWIWVPPGALDGDLDGLGIVVASTSSVSVLSSVVVSVPGPASP
jgi:hypothetical protein